MLENQCRTWPLPLVAVTYAPVTGSTVLGITAGMAPTLDLLREQLAAFHERMHQEGECRG